MHCILLCALGPSAHILIASLLCFVRHATIAGRYTAEYTRNPGPAGFSGSDGRIHCNNLPIHTVLLLPVALFREALEVRGCRSHSQVTSSGNSAGDGPICGKDLLQQPLLSLLSFLSMNSVCRLSLHIASVRDASKYYACAVESWLHSVPCSSISRNPERDKCHPQLRLSIDLALTPFIP